MNEILKGKLEELLQENEDVLISLVNTFISYNGIFADNEIFRMDEIEEIIDCTDGVNLLQRAYYGYDGDITDKEGNHHEPFNPNAEYFYFNVYGNLVSTNYLDYSDLISDCIDNIDSLPYDELPTEIQELFDEFEEM